MSNTQITEEQYKEATNADWGCYGELEFICTYGKALIVEEIDEIPYVSIFESSVSDHFMLRFDDFRSNDSKFIKCIERHKCYTKKEVEKLLVDFITK